MRRDQRPNLILRCSSLNTILPAEALVFRAEDPGNLRRGPGLQFTTLSAVLLAWQIKICFMADQ